MEEKPKVAAVVVTYDRSELLMQCLDTIQEQTVACHILVVDNASTDDTEKKVEERRKEESDLYYHNMGRNTGGAGGFNYGLRWAMQTGYQYVWLMDDDCLPKPDALEKLLEADKLLGGPENYGFLSSTALWTDGKGCQMNQQGIDKVYYQQAALLREGIIRVNQATFVSLLLPARVIRQFGLPIRDYFIWGDDIEYTHRITVRGGEPGYLVGKSQILHAMASNVGSNIATDSTDRLWRYRYAFRNEADLYRKEGIKGMVRYGLRCARNVLRILFKSKDHRLKRLSILFTGVVQGCLFFPKTESVTA